MNGYLKKSDQLYSEARYFRQRADQIDKKAYEQRKRGIELIPLKEKD